MNLLIYASLVIIPTLLLITFRRLVATLNGRARLLLYFSAALYGVATIVCVMHFGNTGIALKERLGAAMNPNTEPPVCSIGDDVKVTIATYNALRELLTVKRVVIHDCEARTQNGDVLSTNLQVLSWRQNDLYPYSNLHTTDHSKPTKAYVNIRLPADERLAHSTVSFLCEGEVMYLARDGNKYYTAHDSFATNVTFAIAVPRLASHYSRIEAMRNVWWALGALSGLLGFACLMSSLMDS